MDTAVHSLASIPAYSCCSCSASGVVLGTTYLPLYGIKMPGSADLQRRKEARRQTLVNTLVELGADAERLHLAQW
jgi:hypothetical protein